MELNRPVPINRIPERANFGLLPEPEKSSTSYITSAAVNLTALALAIYVGMTASHVVLQHKYEHTELIFPTTPPPEPLKMKVLPPKVEGPKLPEVKLDTPKINMPKIEKEPDLKPIQMEAKQVLPEVKTAKPAIILAPQPKAALTAAAPAQVPQTHPSTARVHLGGTFGVTPNPNVSRPATVAAIGNPYGDMQGGAVAPRGVVGSAGIGNGTRAGSNAGVVGKVATAGIPGVTGTSNPYASGKVTSAGIPQMQGAVAPAPAVPQVIRSTNLEVISKPPVQFTNEARALHVQGDVDLRVTFTAAGQVLVQGVVHGLGHGLDEEARRVAGTDSVSPCHPQRTGGRHHDEYYDYVPIGISSRRTTSGDCPGKTGVDMNFRKLPTTFLLIALSATYAYARKEPKYQTVHPLTADQHALVQKAIGREKVLIKNIQQRTPLVETYIQDIRSDVKLYQVPVSDQYMLSRVDFGKGFFDKSFQPRTESKKNGAWLKGSLASITNLTKALGLDTKFTYKPLGFTEMMFLDPSGFDEQHYVFGYVRKEFLGSVRTWAFDVRPKVAGMGRFYGRVWIEDEDGNIVRFNGTFTPPSDKDSSKYYFHFDSWRLNVQPGIWLPVAVYVEETQRTEGDKQIGLKAQTHFWGYSLKLPTRDSENVSVKVEDAVDKSDDAADVSPLQASREWVTQAENNVIDRLVEAGLVAPPTPNGFEQTVLDQIVTNLAVPNNLVSSSPIHCRIMLTDTVETTTVGNTILISKGLIDTLPFNEATIASVISMELAHIALGHHINTRYAFNDRLLFPDEATFQRIKMYHFDHDNDEAVKTAQKYLENSMYKDQLATAGLFWEQLADRGRVLKALNMPKLGDSLLRPDGSPWMLALAHSAPKINWDDLAQIPALPLGSWLKTDPWDDRVHKLNAKLYAPMNPRDKMPLEVTPVYFNLQRYAEANMQAASHTLQEQTSTSNDANAPASSPQPSAPPSASQQTVPADSSAQQQQPPVPAPQFR